MKKSYLKNIEILDLIQAKVPYIESELNGVLTPVRNILKKEENYRNFKAMVFNKFATSWEVAVGYNGENTYQKGERWEFSINLTSRKFKFEQWESERIETFEDFELWFDFLLEKIVKKVYYFYEWQNDCGTTKEMAYKRLLKTLQPLEYFKKFGDESIYA